MLQNSLQQAGLRLTLSQTKTTSLLLTDMKQFSELFSEKKCSLFLSGWCVHQGPVPTRGRLGQEKPVSDRGHTHAACLSDTHHTLQTCGEQEKGYQR